MNTLDSIREKFGYEGYKAWDIVSTCCKAGTMPHIDQHLEGEAYEVCSKCLKRCTSKYVEYPQPRVVELADMNRVKFAYLLAELGLNKGAEIGVECGLYSEVLCKANPNIQLYSIDAWTAYKGYRDHVSQEKLDGFMEITKKRLAPYNAKVIKGFSMDIVKQFKDESLDFVYIDGNHEFQQTVNDIAEWQKKVRPGGIVAGHDYILRKNNGYLMHVPHAIHGYCDSYDIKPLFILGKKSDPKPPVGYRDTARSFFYVKPEPHAIVPGSGHKIQT